MPSEVVLSRRNLLSLLHKLEMPGSFCTIIKPDGTAIKVEPDEVHYANRVGGPGTMHADTEQFVADLEEALKIVRRKRAGPIDPTVGKGIDDCASASQAKEAPGPVITVTNPNPVPPDMPVAFTSLYRRAGDDAWPTDQSAAELMQDAKVPSAGERAEKLLHYNRLARKPSQGETT